MRKRFLISIFYLLVCIMPVSGQEHTLELNSGWMFSRKGDRQWRLAEVPGTIHTDLLRHRLIPDPFYRDNEAKVQWVEKEEWWYRKTFSLPKTFFQKKHIELQFDGLDTDADVFLNGKKILRAGNMFRQWIVDVTSVLQQQNLLEIRFLPSATIAGKQKEQNHKYPDNERVFVRKAQYQFGWDWGPRLVTCGIWKPLRITAFDEPPKSKIVAAVRPEVKLVRKKDAVGESFSFTVDGKPVFIRGANWIPSDNFLPRAKKRKQYETLIRAAKDAHINMLRVWGGGVYEDDDFYDLCDRYGIMVWQDFMFAGALYPADTAFLQNIKEEVRYQVQRLRHHPCIVLWCGNNEIEEAWFNWGWQKQLGYTARDSMDMWSDYQKIFHRLIPDLLQELDPLRPYWPSSPSLGWGRDSAYKKGDVHYWGVWWGKEPVDRYRHKIGRFHSEYGMQGMPDMRTIRSFTLPQDRDTASSVMRMHQKHPFGYENIRWYTEQKFPAPNRFEDLVYVSQLMQGDAIKTAIEAHRWNKPFTMGTMFWQWNDCWPVVSWSAVDYAARKKALFYEVKRSFADVVILVLPEDSGRRVKIVTEGKVEEGLELHADLFSTDSIYTDVQKQLGIRTDPDSGTVVRFDGLSAKNKTGVRYRLLHKGTIRAEQVWLFPLPKDLALKQPHIKVVVHKGYMELTSDTFAYGVFVEAPDEVVLSDNYFHLLPGETKRVAFQSALPDAVIQKQIRVRSLGDVPVK